MSAIWVGWSLGWSPAICAVCVKWYTQEPAEGSSDEYTDEYGISIIKNSSDEGSSDEDSSDEDTQEPYYDSSDGGNESEEGVFKGGYWSKDTQEPAENSSDEDSSDEDLRETIQHWLSQQAYPAARCTG